jgi:hypothetical protein
MAYVLDGLNNEADGFTTAIANFALRAMHESTGLVEFTQVVAPNQGNQYLVPNFAPITYQDYAPNAAPGTGFGTNGAVEQNPSLGQGSITATPAVAATAFDVFYAWTTSFELAATLGAELGESYGEKVDARVCEAFVGDGGVTSGFKGTPGNTNYSPEPQDGFARPLALGAMEVIGATNTSGTWTQGFTSNTILGLVRNVKQNYKAARLPGTPIIVLDSNGDAQTESGYTGDQNGSSLNRLLAELTGGAVSTSGGSNLSNLGNELLSTGRIESVYGCAVIFTTFLSSAVRTVVGVSSLPVLVGAYFHETAIFTVLKEGLQIKMGEKPGGLQMWLTGLAYMGAGVADKRRGGAINILQA